MITQESALVRTMHTPSSHDTRSWIRRHSGQVGKVLGERWKALNPKQKEPYDAKAKADKERYEKEKASYNVSRPLARFSMRNDLDLRFSPDTGQ